VTLIYPFADVLMVALFIAAAAQAGWRLKGWTPFIVGTIVISIADCAFAARALGAQGEVYELAAVGWSMAYVAFAVGAWSRGAVPEPFPAGRPAVPVTLGAISAAVLGLAALDAVPVAAVSAGFALLGVVGVLVRFGVTLGQNERMVRSAQDQALSDALTGLPNRRRLESDLGHAAANATLDSPSALALFDLDGFKRFNDGLGHQAGDDLLATIGRRLGDAVEGWGTAYRLGGDEFCVLVHECQEDTGTRIASAARALSSEVTGFPVAPSYGTARIPQEAADASAALLLADQRMYRHKASKPGRPRLVVTPATERRRATGTARA
jgi:diguanylate cyclase (GGDEF)-like protein